MKRHTCVAVLLAAALTLAACGGGGSAGDAGGGGKQSITVADTDGIPSLFLTYGVREGHFADAGLDVKVTTQVGGAAAIPALMSGEVDAAGSNVVSLLLAASRGLPLSIVAAGTSAAEKSEEDFSGLVVAKGSDIKSPADLRGARIGVNTLKNINEVVIGGVLEAEGLRLQDVELVEMPFPDMQAALERGDIDASFLIEPFLTMALSDGMKAVARPYTAMHPGMQVGGYAMTQETVQSNPELVKAFQQGIQATADAIAENPDAFRKALPRLGEFDPKIAAEMSLPVWRGANDQDAIQVLNEHAAKYGTIRKEVDLGKLLYQGS